MNVTEVARRYAGALFTIAKQKGAQAQAMGELNVIRDLIQKDASVREYFANPLISPDQKMHVIKTAFAGKGVMQEIVDFLTLLAQKNRLSQLSSIVDGFQLRLDEEQGVTRGVVRAARPLTAAAMKDLEGKISTTLKKKIVLSFQEDPRLLGGVIAQVGGWTFDDSIETHLRKMNEELNRSAR